MRAAAPSTMVKAFHPWTVLSPPFGSFWILRSLAKRPRPHPAAAQRSRRSGVPAALLARPLSPVVGRSVRRAERNALAVRLGADRRYRSLEL